MRLVAPSKRRAKTCGPTRSPAMRAGVRVFSTRYGLGGRFAVNLARGEQSFGAERFEPGGRNADEDENDRRDCAHSAGTAGWRAIEEVRQSWSVVTLVSGQPALVIRRGSCGVCGIPWPFSD